MLPDLAEPCRGQFTTPLRVCATETTLLNTEPQSYLPGSHDIMYLLTCELAVSRFATARVGSPNRPDFAGHKNRGGARRSHFCGSAWALRSDIDRSFEPRATCVGPHLVQLGQ